MVHNWGMGTLRLPGMLMTDHTIEVPLDHSRPDGPTIEVFAREVTAPDRDPENLPWLLFLQGGPGSGSPRPVRAEGWIATALQRFRLLLLDQRGTGRSSPVRAQTVRGRSPEELAAYLRFFRADSIVADAELLRRRVAGGRPWHTLGQSYGGFVTLTYLSQAPDALSACYVTGGLAPLSATADEVYARAYRRVQEKVSGFYARYADDGPAIRRIVEHLAATDVRLPDGDRLTVERFQTLGHGFGMRDGYERLHWLVEDAWAGDELSDAFLCHVMVATGYVDGPLYATLHESIYAQQGHATKWSAQRVRSDLGTFESDVDPVPLTGEMIYPWMFRDISLLRPFAGAADILADVDDWPDLYDPAVLARNTVPVAAVVYHDDMYVDAQHSLGTARAIPNTRVWVTNEWQHDGLRVSGGAVLSHLLSLHELNP